MAEKNLYTQDGTIKLTNHKIQNYYIYKIQTSLTC